MRSPGISNPFLEAQLESYTESWQQDHTRAMACWELESRLELSLALFDFVRRVDEQWSNGVRSGVAEYSAAGSEPVGSLYKEWLRPAEQILRSIGDCEQAGFNVTGSERFRNADREARLALSVEPLRLAASDEELIAGGGHRLRDVLDELRRDHLNSRQG